MDCFKQGYSNDKWLGNNDDYTVKAGYHWLRNSGSKVRWWRICWNSMIVPKASYIFWLYSLGRLLTKDRIWRMGGSSDLLCYLCCNADESHGHLFFYCAFSTRCVHLLQRQLKLHFNPRQLVTWNSRGRRNSTLKRRTTCAFYVQLIYLTWQERNRARLHNQVTNPRVLVKHGIGDVCKRFWTRNRAGITSVENSWITNLSSL